jgi:hypothetical protein
MFVEIGLVIAKDKQECQIEGVEPQQLYLS